MIQLKDYQNRVLEALKEYLRLCSRTGRPDTAFITIQSRSNNVLLPYISIPVTGLSASMPYICLRVPTGGGKTLLACYAAGLASNELLHTEKSVVLWLVPSNTILDQTLKALRDKTHPYRQALETACGQVEVVSIEEALFMSRALLDGQTIVIVSTLQSFRVEDKNGRKVYDNNGTFMEHLLNLPLDRTGDLELGLDGNPKPCLSNALRLRRPIVIVDEAHNARTDLSFSTLGNLLPSCIIEFTATPARKENASNVLYRVSAAELKEAEMIKIPLRIITRQSSQRDQLLSDAITLRGELEKLAIVEGQTTGEYIRPILLIQAEKVDACKPLRERMTNELDIPAEQIIISTGSLDELKNISDVMAQNCPVRYIITVEKLREGWDCPFAYVLCSLKETYSATAIEQIVGRILRLPHARTKQHPDLNCSYAFSVSESLPEVLNELKEALESNGFTSAEADRIVIPVSQIGLSLGTQNKSITLEPAVIDSEIARQLEPYLASKVNIDVNKGEIRLTAYLNLFEAEKLVGCLKTAEAKIAVRKLIDDVNKSEMALRPENLTKVPSPFELHFDFTVPLLGVEENGQLFEFDATSILEHYWRLTDKDSSLPDSYNPLVKLDMKLGEIDIASSGQLQTFQLSDKQNINFITRLQQNVMQLNVKSNWIIEELIRWLDNHIEHPDIPISESVEFIRRAVRGAMAKYNINNVDILAADRFRLRDEIEAIIQSHRFLERKKAFQQYLIPDSGLIVRDDYNINFKDMGYEPSWLCQNSFIFKKHYFGPKPGELQDINNNGLTEEFKCAQYIDSLDAVKYWVRNLSRRYTSFRLQTSTDWFYPDFVCQLNGGRILVVEYKGRYIYDASDAEEKRTIGAVWASRSNGHCLFVMPTDNNYQAINDAIKGK